MQFCHYSPHFYQVCVHFPISCLLMSGKSNQKSLKAKNCSYIDTRPFQWNNTVLKHIVFQIHGYMPVRMRQNRQKILKKIKQKMKKMKCLTLSPPRLSLCSGRLSKVFSLEGVGTNKDYDYPTNVDLAPLNWNS